MNVKITKVFTSTTDKQGKPLMGKNGKPYTRMAIKTQEHGEKWLSGFQNAYNANWKEGDTVDLEIDEVFRDGKAYLNFRSLTKIDLLEARIVKIEEAIRRLEKEDVEIPLVESEKEMPDLSDIPF